jgi:hypothetical protein
MPAALSETAGAVGRFWLRCVNRHRARKSKSPSSFGHATAKDTVTRTAPRRHHHGQRPRLTSRNKADNHKLRAVTKPLKPALTPKRLNPAALGSNVSAPCSGCVEEVSFPLKFPSASTGDFLPRQESQPRSRQAWAG